MSAHVWMCWAWVSVRMSVAMAWGRAHMSAPSAPAQVLVIAVLAQVGMSDMWLRQVLVWIATA
jgi:hypothetical protein